MHSAIFEGSVRHRRRAEIRHAFRYRMFMMYLDLDELDRVFRGRWLWSARRVALAWFRREDHFGDPREPLAESVRDLVGRATGTRPVGPIRLLTHLRYFGYCFNPVSFYYCFNDAGSELAALVAEVNNTPWGERQLYVLGAADDAGDSGVMQFVTRKAMHVSPFLPMDMDYRWRLNVPGERLRVHMENRRLGETLFDATLALRRTEISGRSLAGVLIRFPWMTFRVIAAIHWQALRLWWKGARVYDHPGKGRQNIPQGGQ